MEYMSRHYHVQMLKRSLHERVCVHNDSSGEDKLQRKTKNGVFQTDITE